MSHQELIARLVSRWFRGQLVGGWFRGELVGEWFRGELVGEWFRGELVGEWFRGELVGEWFRAICSRGGSGAICSRGGSGARGCRARLEPARRARAGARSSGWGPFGGVGSPVVRRRSVWCPPEGPAAREGGSRFFHQERAPVARSACASGLHLGLAAVDHRGRAGAGGARRGALGEKTSSTPSRGPGGKVVARSRIAARTRPPTRVAAGQKW
jgi:hypothetical protein